jgi:hypothetical protein
MTDKELLELAAKAIGAELLDCTCKKERKNSLTGKHWNPLTDDGDALRLTVKLNILRGYIHNDEVALAPSEYGVIEPITNNDPYAATRRAIVRVAAEIGKSK